MVLAAGCSAFQESDDEGDTVTGVDDTSGEGVLAQCVVADPTGAVIMQPGSLTVDARTRLLTVSLDDAVNLEVVEDVVAPYRGPDDLQGVVADYPPGASTSFIEGLTDWNSRRTLTGLTLHPDDGKQAVLVAVRLTEPDRPAHVRGVTISADTPAGPRLYGWEQLVLVLPDGKCSDEVVAETTAWTG